ncbi:DUF2339 domain-containing protein [Pelagimonas varians]|uniref:DUF2339 domain-containing protein n=1 Tax=Pelagimonas varians TaxID=696760 RepID=A0A238K1C6_9RHOB|nr:DUF2339 domain-containing protein [Pelagimonas varians]PYG33394.1 putative membrane protein [Pelagimonas varians]SMX36573.1 hypothetical protein PEV8663_00853 [Pelagimonas varians]
MYDFLYLVIGLLVLAIPASVVYLLVSHVRLRRQVAELTAQLELLWRDSGPPKAPPAKAAENVVPLGTSARPADQIQSAPPEITVPKPPWKRPDHPKTDSKLQRQPSQATVLNAQRFAALTRWLTANWFYVAAAASLALAGVFFVQYGIETGILSPTARIASALVFGACLIVAGEWIRRKYGDDESSATAYLPSVLSGAGLVSLMGGILAARMMYGLIGATPAFAGLFAVAMLGMVLGWFHGSLLAAIGLLGGLAAPFLVGGSSQTPEWLFLYFGLMVILGLGIDTVRRWAWISVLTLVAGMGAGAALWASGMSNAALNAGFAAYCSGMIIAAVLIPSRGLWPDHGGPSFVQTFWDLKQNKIRAVWPIFPVRLSMGITTAACVPLVLTAQNSVGTFWLSLALASGLAVLFILWVRAAPAIQDHTVIPAGIILALLAWPDANWHVRQLMHDTLLAHEGQTEVRMLWGVSMALLAALVPTLVAAWRSFNAVQYQAVWTALAVLLAPLAGIALELTWHPVDLIGEWPWAFHALGLSCLMTALAVQYARTESANKMRISLAVISALACLAFALGIVLTEAALTLALAATVLSAAALDRRFDLPLLGAYILSGVIGVGFRLVFDPGLDWATIAPFWEMFLTYGGTSIALFVAFRLQIPLPRPKAQVVLESATWSVGGLTLSLVLYHAIEHFAGHDVTGMHWQMGLYATIWVLLASAQIHRMQLGGSLLWVRAALAATYAICAAGAIVVSVTLANPLLEPQNVIGVVIVNTLLAAYLLPAGALVLSSRILPKKFVRLRFVVNALAILLTVVWTALAIRHGWRGNAAMPVQFGLTQPELYTYTVTLLLTGASLFYQALARKSDLLRRAGVFVMALAVAKVFLIDISGLQGLVRVFSFLVLGLSLAGLAWLNRWVGLRADDPEPEAKAQSEPD